MLLINRLSIFHHKDFEFEDGSSKDKYILTLNCNVHGKDVSFILPTSNVTTYEKNSNLKYDTVFIQPSESQFFSKTTVIDLKQIQSRPRASFEEKHQKGLLTYKGVLEADIAIRIENTIRNAITLSPVEKKTYLCEDQ